jgi:hypothetical protein
VLFGTSSFSGSSNGTIFAINTPSSPSFTGNLADLQVNSSSKFTVSYTGAVSAESLTLSATTASVSTSTGALIISGGVGIAGSLNLGTALSVSNGGTGVTSATSGQILIGNTSGTFTLATISGSNGIGITNGDGSITITNNRLNSLNGLTTTTQTFAVSTSGSDFAITSSGTAHTFGLPDASTSARGVISTSSQTLGGLKTFNDGLKSAYFYTGLDGYFGGDPTVFTTQGTTGAIYLGILKSNASNRFAGMKVLEKQSPTLGAGYLYSDIVFYTDAEAEEFSTERLRIDGAGLITAAKDVTINGNLTLPNNPLAVAYGGTGNTSYTNGQLLIGNSTGNTLTKSTLTAGSNISITNGTGSITIAATIPRSKSVCILSPTNTDSLTLFYTDTAITLSKVAVALRGSSPSVTYSIYYDQDRSSGSPTTVLSSTANTGNSATTTGQITTLSSNNTPLASSFIWLNITSVTNATEFHLTLFYT